MKYKLIIFDIDGTLIDTEFAVLNSLCETINFINNADFRPEELKFSLGIPSEEALIKLNVEKSRLKEAYDLWNENFEKYIPEIKFFDGIAELLKNIKKAQITMALLTSKDLIELNKDFVPLGIMDYFEFMATAESTKKQKPNPEPMLHILKKSGFKPGDAIFIGDSIYDMQCAKSAGVDCALALWGRDEADGIKATYYPQKPNDIWEIISR